MLGSHDHQLFECWLVADRQIGQNFAVQFHTCLFQPIYEPAVGCAQLAASGTNANDPETPEIALPFPSVAVGVVPCVNEGLFGPLVVSVGRAVKTTGSQQHLFVPGMFSDTTFNSRQNRSPV